jgi:hypothetical protein
MPHARRLWPKFSVLKLEERGLAPFEIPPRGATHSIFPGKNDRWVRAEIVILPLNLEFHFRWRFAADFEEVTNGECRLGGKPFPACPRFSEFTDDFNGHLIL